MQGRPFLIRQIQAQQPQLRLVLEKGKGLVREGVGKNVTVCDKGEKGGKQEVWHHTFLVKKKPKYFKLPDQILKLY